MALDKKGMAAMIDAFMFITIIGLIAAGMFAYSHGAVEDTVAKDAYDSFFDIKLRTNDVFDGTDTQPVGICDLVAAYMMTGNGDILGYAENALRSIISPVHGYSMTFEYNGRTLTIGDGGNVLTSRYSSEMTISDGKIMRASLSIY